MEKVVARGRYRRHSPHFKFQLCSNIRTGVVGSRDAQRTYKLSANLIPTWPAHYDAGEITDADIESSMINEYEAIIAALEGKVGKLKMEVDLFKKIRRRDPGLHNDDSLIVTGPLGAPTVEGAT